MAAAIKNAISSQYSEIRRKEKVKTDDIKTSSQLIGKNSKLRKKHDDQVISIRSIIKTLVSYNSSKKLRS